MAKPDNTKLTFNLPRALHTACHAAAARDGRSLSNWLRHVLTKAVRGETPLTNPPKQVKRDRSVAHLEALTSPPAPTRPLALSPLMHALAAPKVAPPETQ